MPRIPRESPPVAIIKPRSTLPSVAIREAWEFRDLLASFLIRDVTLRYRQTALGVGWVVVQPLLGAGVLAFVFGRVAGLSSDGVPYVLFAFCGMVGWSVFSSTLTRTASSLIVNASLLSKTAFPRVLLPLAAAGSAMVDIAVTVSMLGVLMVTYRVAPTVNMILLPVWLLGLLVLATGVGLCAAALVVRYRDVQHALPLATQLLLYASPVAYSLNAVPSGTQGPLAINPLTSLFEGLRWSVFDTPAPSAGGVMYSFTVSTVVLALGLVTFASLEGEFADVI